MVTGIPKLLWQTTHLNPATVPTQTLLGENAAGYERTVTDDAACEAFISDHFPRAVDAFRALAGAHRADLWRYCILFVHGGIYLDIKTVLHQPLDTLFPSRDDKLTWYTIICANKICLFNGIIATPPRNPIFLTLIEYIVAHAPPREHYGDYVNHMKRVVEAQYGAHVRDDVVLEDAATRLVLRSEICRKKECRFTPKKVVDRLGLCCNVYDRAIDQRMPVITVRDADYPWDGSVERARAKERRCVVFVSVGVATAIVTSVLILLLMWWRRHGRLVLSLSRLS